MQEPSVACRRVSKVNLMTLNVCYIAAHFICHPSFSDDVACAPAAEACTKAKRSIILCTAVVGMDVRPACIHLQ
jgi:hypothetical protein